VSFIAFEKYSKRKRGANDSGARVENIFNPAFEQPRNGESERKTWVVTLVSMALTI